MTEADELADRIEDIIRDFVHPEGGTDTAAREIVRQLPALLYQEGWTPPDVNERIFSGIHGWVERTLKLPDHHISRDILTSHLSELTDILNDGR